MECGVGKWIAWILLCFLTRYYLGVNITLADLPGLLKSYLTSLPSPPEGWNSLGPILGGIKAGASDLR